MIAALIVVAQLAAGGAPVEGTDTARARHHRMAIEAAVGGSAGEATMAASGAQWLPGAAWRAGMAMRVTRHVEIYAGYGSRSFDCQAGFCRNRPVAFTSAGIDAGARLRAGPVWGQVGAVRHQLGAAWREGSGGPQQQVSAAPALGWEAGAGLALPIGRIELLPGVRYGTYRTRFDGAAEDDAVGYLAAELGLRMPISRLWR